MGPLESDFADLGVAVTLRSYICHVYLHDAKIEVSLS